MTVTAEQLYSYYHQMTFFHEKGIHPKAVNDFTNAKSKDWWPKFVTAASIINTNPNVDYRMLIDALASTYKNRFDPGMLFHPKGMKIYNSYIKIHNDTTDIHNIEEIVKNDMMAVCQEIINYDIGNFMDYIDYNSSIIPIMALNYGSGLISSFFLASIPDVKSIIQGYQQDIQDEYFIHFMETFEVTRGRILKSAKLRKISDNFYEIMNSYIKKQKGTVILTVANNNNPNKESTND
jgi:anthranilate/para-aminobenzoate synthase component II